MSEDPIVAEVRSVRERLAARFNYDVHAIFDDLRRNQATTGMRLVRRARTNRAASRPPDQAALHPGR